MQPSFIQGGPLARLRLLHLHLGNVEAAEGVRLRHHCWLHLIVDQSLDQHLVEGLVNERRAGSEQALAPLPVSADPAQGLQGLPVRLEACVDDLREPSQWRAEVGPSDHQSVRYDEDGPLS